MSPSSLVMYSLPQHPCEGKSTAVSRYRWETEVKRRNTMPIRRNAYLLSLGFLPSLSFKSRSSVNVVVDLNQQALLNSLSVLTHYSIILRYFYCFWATWPITSKEACCSLCTDRCALVYSTLAGWFKIYWNSFKWFLQFHCVFNQVLSCYLNTCVGQNFAEWTKIAYILP